MATLALRIESTEASQGWSGRWLDGQDELGSRIEISGSAANALRFLGRQFLGLFDSDGLGGSPGRPFVVPNALRSLGRELFQAWFEPSWPSLEGRLEGAGPHRLIIQSADHEVLNLPWELVEFGPDRALGCDAAWSLCRSPLIGRIGAGGPLRPGPLRILFLASAPLDQVQLDYEREEDAMLKAIARLQDVGFHFAEAGSFDALRDLVAEYRPHLLHLSGHGSVDREGMGSFAFEDERGRTDIRKADEIVADVFRGNAHQVHCVFFNGCLTSQAATAGLCQSLVAAGVPIALGWAASVADDRATDFAAEFYGRVARGEAVPVAAAHARERIRRAGLVGKGTADPMQDATYVLPQVYAPYSDGALYDPRLPQDPDERLRTRYTLLGDGVKGLREGFIGRRREIQGLVPALCEGEATFVVLTGIGGAGKSTLATRIANRLESRGFRVLPVRAEVDQGGPLEAGRTLLARLVGAIDDEFIRAGRQDLHAQIADGNFPAEQRHRLAIKGLNELRLVLVIDNFEDVLDLRGRRIVDPDLANFYRTLGSELVRGSRVVVTCRYLPAETPKSLLNVVHWPLAEFAESSFIKFLRRDPIVEGRIAGGELDAALLSSLYRAFGGTPGFLDNLRRVLRKADLDELRDELEGMSLGALDEAREAYFQRIVTARLYEALGSQARALVSRLAMSEFPLPVDGVAAIAGAEAGVELDLEACSAFGLLQRFDEANRPSLYHPPGLLRPWLSASERLPEGDAREIDRRLAAFWRSSYESGRETDLRVPIDVQLIGCRAHARRGGEIQLFRWATVRMAELLRRRAEWHAARALLKEISSEDHDAESLRSLAILEESLGEWKVARSLLERAIGLSDDDTIGEAAAWHQLATIDLREGEHAAAREKFARSLATRQAIGDRAGEAATWHNLATIDLNEGQYAAAREKFAKSLAIHRAIGDRVGEAATWHNLATIDLNEGQYAAAREKFAKSLAIKEAIGDRAGEAATWHQLATIDLREGEHAVAREKLARSLATRQAIGDRAGEAAAWHQLATIDLREGEHAAAREKFARSLAILQEIGDRAGEAAAWHQLATIDVNEGRYAAAREKSARSLDAMQKIRDRAGEAAAWHQLATIDLREGEHAAAREKFARSLAILQEIGDRVGEAAAWHQLATIDVNEGRYAAAREKFARSLATRQAIGDRAGEAAIWHQLATIDLREGEHAAAREKFARSLAIKQEIGNKAGEAATFFQLGSLAHKLGRGRDGALLMAVCCLIHRAIGHGDTESDFRALASLCQSLGYDQSQFDGLLEETIWEYQRDRGQALIARLFAEGEGGAS